MTAMEKNLHLISAVELKQRLDNNQVLLIDVREPGEFSAERIPGARLMPLSKFDPKSIPDTDKEVVLYCRSGKRSEIAAQRLLEEGWRSVTNLKGGITSWKAAGLPIDKDANAPISLIRQVQIVAGSLVLAGTVLGATVNPRFLFLSGFVGAGLVFAGVTDTCALGMLLSKLPYNQRAGQSWNS